MDDATAGPDYLRRDDHERAQEGAELHAQHAVAFRAVSLGPSSTSGQQQRDPCLQRPSERRHHHVSPVAHEVADRHLKRGDAALELRVQVLLVAAVIGAQDDLGRRTLPVVRDEVEEHHVVEKSLLASRDCEVLAKDHDAMRLRARVRLIGEARHVLCVRALARESAAAHDSVLDVLAATTRLCQGFMLGRPP